ncbi:MAG TPA: hypothetical protein VGG46_08795 [Terriglobales bacterium]|jgi:hypothetical protein
MKLVTVQVAKMIRIRAAPSGLPHEACPIPLSGAEGLKPVKFFVLQRYGQSHILIRTASMQTAPLSEILCGTKSWLWP